MIIQFLEKEAKSWKDEKTMELLGSGCQFEIKQRFLYRVYNIYGIWDLVLNLPGY